MYQVGNLDPSLHLSPPGILLLGTRGSHSTLHPLSCTTCKTSGGLARSADLIDVMIGFMDNELSGWWYLSFVSTSGVWVGGVIVRGIDEQSALDEATRLRINPGGDTMLAPIPTDVLPSEEWRNRLLSKDEIKTFWPDSKTVKEYADEGVFIESATVCSSCNPGKPV